MAKTKDGYEAHAVYLPRKAGWFWSVQVGQRGIFYGPYRNEAQAKSQGPKDDEANMLPHPEAK